MTRNRNSLLSDIAFLLFIVLCYACIIFIAGDSGMYVENLFFLHFALLFAVITYFTTVLTGLVLNILFIFGYGSYILYQTVVQGTPVGANSYFWLVITPLFTLVIWMVTLANRQLQAENDQLQRQAARLATIDEGTDLKNIRSFHKDVTVFSGISVRYQIPLTLLVIKVKYWNELRRMIDAVQLSEAIYDVSRISQASIRTNDVLYLLDKEDATWGLLLFTDREGSKVVIDRIKQSLLQFNTQDFADKYKIELNLKIGAVQYDPDVIESPLDFIARAKKQLEYDV